MSEPAVSICLTAYMRGDSIGGTIESLLGQDLGDFELLVCDDASTDATEEVCRAYERLDRRVTYHRNERNLGMPGNLNAGLRRCRAPLLANLHDGDLYRQDLLSRWKRGLDEYPDAAFAFCQLAYIDGGPGRISNPDLPERIERDALLRFMLSDRVCYGSPVWGTVMGRRSAYQAVGWFDARFSWFSDVWMWMRLNHLFPVVYVREPLIRLMPHEADRPYARHDWWLERIIMTMYEDAVDLLHGGDAVAVARERARIRGIRDGRWLRSIGSAFRRGRLEEAREGLAICRLEDSARLRLAGRLGVPMLWLAGNRVFQNAVRLLDGAWRGRWD